MSLQIVDLSSQWNMRYVMMGTLIRGVGLCHKYLLKRNQLF